MKMKIRELGQNNAADRDRERAGVTGIHAYNWLSCLQLAVVLTVGCRAYNWLSCLQLAVVLTIGYRAYDWLSCFQLTGD